MEAYLVIAIIFGLLLLIISINDFLFFRIENEYVVACLVLYIISCICGYSGNFFREGVCVASIMFVVCFILNHLNMIGGGDVKLLFPLLLFAENNWVTFLIGVSIGGFFLALAYMLFYRRIFFIRRKLVLSLYLFRRNHKTDVFLSFVLLSIDRINKKLVAFNRLKIGAMKQEIPYGIALACGGFFLIFEHMVIR